MNPSILTSEEAEAMLVRLSAHFGEPVMPIARYCAKLETWMRVMLQSAAPGRTDHIRATWHAVRKSNLLARMLYGNEALRLTPCPNHLGHYSGQHVEDCPHGCGHTGWLPLTEAERLVFKALQGPDVQGAQHVSYWFGRLQDPSPSDTCPAVIRAWFGRLDAASRVATLEILARIQAVLG